MSTLDSGEGHDWLHTKGAPEAVLPRCTTALRADGSERPLADSERQHITGQVESFAGQGLRVLALARRALPSGAGAPERERGRERPVLPRAGHDARPASRRGVRGGRPLPQRRDPDHRHHRRSPPDRRGDRRPGRHRRRGSSGRQRPGVRPHPRAGDQRHPRHRARGHLRACLTRDEAADRRGAARTGTRGRDDGRRCQRCAGAAPRGHRRGDGAVRNRRRPRGIHDGAHR